MLKVTRLYIAKPGLDCRSGPKACATVRAWESKGRAGGNEVQPEEGKAKGKPRGHVDRVLGPMCATRGRMGDRGEGGEPQINTQSDSWNIFLPAPCKLHLFHEVVRSPRAAEAKGHASGLP